MKVAATGGIRTRQPTSATKSTWCECTASGFANNAASLVGPYKGPPERTVVNCVDEKPSIQVPGPAQSYLRVSNGRMLISRGKSCKRNGTSTMLAVLEIATDKVTVAHRNRHYRFGFIGFMNEFIAAPPSATVTYIVLGDLSTHEPRNGRWLRRYLNV